MVLRMSVILMFADISRSSKLNSFTMSVVLTQHDVFCVQCLQTSSRPPAYATAASRGLR